MNYVKLALFLGWTAFIFASGLKISDWRHDSVELAAREAATAAAEVQARRESKIAADVLTAIRNEDFKERVIEKRIREVTEREIYKTECIDDDGLAIVNGLYANLPPEGTPAAPSSVAPALP